MPLTAAFSATQSLANNDEITLTDTSTGSDGTITTRRIYITLANGNWLTTSGESTTVAYTEWDYADTSITLDILSQSTACNIEVQWLANTTIVYTVTEEYCFNLYDYLFALQLLQGNTSSPNQIQDTTFYSNFIQFIVNLFNEENAIQYGGDIYSSQGAMNQNELMISNESDFF